MAEQIQMCLKKDMKVNRGELKALNRETDAKMEWEKRCKTQNIKTLSPIE